VVSKNSGGSATEAKLEVARERGLPVIMLRRPPLPEVEREFDRVADLLDALRAHQVELRAVPHAPGSAAK
jgi:precorrin-6A/cobalt-precorrin-6A reductase